MLNIFEPTTLPIAISDCFLIAATTEVANSGTLVPAATIVNPIIASETSKLRAIITEFFTSIPDP